MMLHTYDSDLVSIQFNTLIHLRTGLVLLIHLLVLGVLTRVTAGNICAAFVDC